MGLNIYLMVRDGDRLPEDDPLHNFATRRGGQRTRVPVIAPQGRRQEIPEDKRIQKGLLLCVEEEGKERHNDDKSYYAVDIQLKPPACWCHITSLLFVYILRSTSIWWWEDHSKQSSVSQGAFGGTMVHCISRKMKNGFHEERLWATCRPLLLPAQRTDKTLP